MIVSMASFGILSSPRPATPWRSRPARTVVTCVMLTVALGTACEAQGGGPSRARTVDTAASAPTSAASRAPESPDPSGKVGALPVLPARRSPATLAAQISAAERTIGDPDARGSDVRRAGELAQLSARLLARAPLGFRRDVLARLGPRTRAKTRLDVGAASLLNAMTSPATKLPKWRIVQPPPPRVLLAHYRFAARRVGVPWTYLAAIHLVETRMGRIRGISTAGARGPMQFLPTTWDLYGKGGDINDPRDAILAAARLLRANGAPGDMDGAVWHYNPSSSYVGAVARYAKAIGRSPLAYRGYWQWRVLYKHVRGTYVLDIGYPRVRARLLGRD